jgi:hypothetical protein
LNTLGIPHPGPTDPADNPAADRFRREILSDPSRVVDINKASEETGHGLIVLGASPEDGTPPTEGCEIPTDAHLQSLSLFAPTGTVADAIHARDALQDLLIRRQLPCAGFLQAIADRFDPPMPATIQTAIWSGWLSAVADPDSALIYINADLVDALVAAANTMPEMADVPSLRLPMSGLIVLGKTIGTGRSDPDDPLLQWIPDFTGPKHTALTFNTYPPEAAEASGSWMLQVTPWSRPGMSGAGYLHGDVLRMEDRAAGAELISGPLAPNTPSWIDGDYPRKQGTDLTGARYGWNGSPNFYLRFVAALALWLQQEVVRVDDGNKELSRPARRRLERTKRGATRVKVVKLRRLERPGRTSEEFGGSRTYTKQWFVKGHWRTYWTGPGGTVPEPRWISRYIAGPEDMPLDGGSEAIWKVDR